MPTCPNGHTVAPGNAFCYQCGATIDADQTVVRPAPLSDDTTERPAVQAAPEQHVALPEPPAFAPPFNPGPPVPPPIAMAGYEPPRERRSNNVMIYSLAGLVILLAIGGAIAALLLNSGGSSNDSGQTKNPITNPTIGSTPSSSGGATTGSATVVVSDGCGDPASARPGQFQLECSTPGASLSNLTWTSWDSQGASGTGSYTPPASSGGSAGSVPVSVQMYSPVSGSTGPEFSTITVTPANGPAVTWTQSTPDGAWANSSSQSKAPMPTGGKLCAGLILGKYQFGTFGSNTSCGFVRAVYKAWESSGNQSPVTATSPATHETYSNIVCTVDSTQSWAKCVGGRNNSAQMFFALP